MLEILESIGEFFATIGQYLLYTIKNTGLIIKWLIQAVKMAGFGIQYFFPVALSLGLMVFLLIAVIYKIFGRTS